MNKLIVLALIAAVSCNDLVQGPEGGRKIYDESKEASPAIWKQKNEVTIKANDTDVISRVVITDMRPDKDGEAKIIDGGEGQKNVTVELKSPTILRGYYFHIEVYAVEDDNSDNATKLSYPEESEVITKQMPLENDTKVNGGEFTTESNESVTVEHDKVPAKPIKGVITTESVPTNNLLRKNLSEIPYSKTDLQAPRVLKDEELETNKAVSTTEASA